MLLVESMKLIKIHYDTKTTKLVYSCFREREFLE